MPSSSQRTGSRSSGQRYELWTYFEICPVTRELLPFGEMPDWLDDPPSKVSPREYRQSMDARPLASEAPPEA
jgi:hypothetical protein